MKLFYILSVVLLTSVSADIERNSASTALNQFAIKFFGETCRQVDHTTNIALSPYTVWNVMAILNEGARANTAIELETVLGIPKNGTTDRDEFKKLQQNLMRNIMKNYDGITLELLNVIYTRMGQNLNPYFQQLVRSLYDVDVVPLNFNDEAGSARIINARLSMATNGRIHDIVREDYLRQAQVFVASVLFFKGFWDIQFNKSDTKPQPFYDEQNQEIGPVQMMYNKASFPYSLVLDDKATAIELPYKGEQMSMIIVLPRLKVTLQSILHMMSEKPFSSILDALKQSTEMFGSDNVVVYLPKFEINAQLNLNFVLDQMGIKDIFQDGNADLTGISNDQLFLSRVMHGAQIQVNEEGTTATSVTAAVLENKIPAPVFLANRPFAFFIFDKQTESIVFTGKYSHPTVIKDK